MRDGEYGTDFKLLVDDGIESCQTYLKNIFDLSSGLELVQEMCAKFSKYIDDFQSDNTETIRAMHDVGLRTDAQRLLTANVKKIMYELIAFRSNAYANAKELLNTNGGINVHTNLVANQTQTFNISFEEVKRKIENMTELSKVEAKEITEKIDEIKAIVELNKPKETRWQKVKPILVWLSNKSVDVGISLLPLLLKIGG